MKTPTTYSEVLEEKTKKMQEWQELLDFLKSVDNKEKAVSPHWIMSADDKHLVDVGYESWAENGDFRTSKLFDSKGVTLIEVNLFSLINSVHSSVRRKLLNGKYLKDSEKALRILKEWENNVELTAPCYAIMQGRSQPQILDGHHRITVAISLGAGTIPVIIPEAQLDRFKYATSLERKLLIKTNLL